jgi:hypothetical protein
MAGFTANPAVKPSTDNSSQLQLMKLFTWVLEIHSQVDQNQIFKFARQPRAFFIPGNLSLLSFYIFTEIIIYTSHIFNGLIW